MTALLEVLSEAAVVLGILALVWNVASVVEAWRYLRRREPRRPFALRIVFRRQKPPSNVYRFPERNRAS